MPLSWELTFKTRDCKALTYKGHTSTVPQCEEQSFAMQNSKARSMTIQQHGQMALIRVSEALSCLCGTRLMHYAGCA